MELLVRVFGEHEIPRLLELLAVDFFPFGRSNRFAIDSVSVSLAASTSSMKNRNTLEIQQSV